MHWVQLPHGDANAAQSRLYAGIHTRTDNEMGLQLGRQVAGATLQRLGDVKLAYD